MLLTEQEERGGGRHVRRITNDLTSRYGHIDGTTWSGAAHCLTNEGATWSQQWQHFFFSNNFDFFFFQSEFFSHSTTHRETIFFHPKAFVVIFSFLVPYFECLSDEDFPPKDLELQVNARFLLYVRFFPFYCIYFPTPPPLFLYIFRLFSHFIHNFFLTPISFSSAIFFFISFEWYEMKMSILSLTLSFKEKNILPTPISCSFAIWKMKGKNVVGGGTDEPRYF